MGDMEGMGTAVEVFVGTKPYATYTFMVWKGFTACVV